MEVQMNNNQYIQITKSNSDKFIQDKLYKITEYNKEYGLSFITNELNETSIFCVLYKDKVYKTNKCVHLYGPTEGIFNTTEKEIKQNGV
jgi:hypothetical protein